MGCAFESDNGVCSAIGSRVDSTVFVAGILSKCSQATTQASCVGAVAWHNRFGGKIDCSWCSTACVHSEHADDTCTTTSTLDGFYSTWTETTNTTSNPTETTNTTSNPAPKEGPTTDEVTERVTENGGLSADKTLLGITLAWDNCNDLDLELETPTGESIYWNNLKDGRGGMLDIDMNGLDCASYKPVENIRYEKGATTPEAGVYKAIVRYYGQWDTMLDTPFIIQLNVGNKSQQSTGEVKVVKEYKEYEFTFNGDVENPQGCIGTGC